MNNAEAERSKVTISGDITVEVKSDVAIAPVAKSDIIWNASKKFISITVDGVTYNATPNTHSNFQEILNLLVADKLEEAAQKINVRRAVEKYISGDVRIEGGSLFYQNIELRSGLVDRILDSMEKGENFEFYFPFLENLLENPSQKAVSRLFDFFQAFFNVILKSSSKCINYFLILFINILNSVAFLQRFMFTSKDFIEVFFIHLCSPRHLLHH